jgi:hypothetical protein
MPPTNHYFRSQLQVVDARLKQIERYGVDRVRAAALVQLRQEREMLKLVLLNRLIEAARPVVDLQRWRTANGAVALAEDEQERKAMVVG